MKSSSSLALRMDAAGEADETPETAAAGVRGGLATPRRTGFDYRALEQRAFDRRVILIRAQGLPLFRVY